MWMRMEENFTLDITIHGKLASHVWMIVYKASYHYNRS
jgi:hypothetical protein